MGCAPSSSTKSSAASLQRSNQVSQTPTSKRQTRIVPEGADNSTDLTKQPTVNGSTSSIGTRRTTPASNTGIAFEIDLDEHGQRKKAPPKRLSRLEPIDGPKLTAEELEEKLRLAERKRNNELEHRAKTASASRRLSKRKRELLVAQEFEKQQFQAEELEKKLQSAERQRELKNQLKQEKLRIKEERARMARERKEKMLNGDVIDFDVEQDEHFNNDDVDSWLDGSNNGTNTADTGFSSAASERIYSGRESPKKKFNPNSVSRSNYLNSASTVDSCDVLHYRKNPTAHVDEVQKSAETDNFFDD